MITSALQEFCCALHNLFSSHYDQLHCWLQQQVLVLSRQHGVLSWANPASCSLNADKVAYTLLLLDKLLLSGLDLVAQPIVNDEVITDLIVTITLGSAGTT